MSQLRRASVIALPAGRLVADVYVKGAPECMKAICKPESCKCIKYHHLRLRSVLKGHVVPLDFDDLLEFYTHRGFRVIGCATKQIPYDWARLQEIERDEAESGLDFIGFIVFENKLKPATAETIEQLSRAGIRQVMCTGDNILTAISVGRECCLLDRTAHCFVAHFADGMLAVLPKAFPIDLGLGLGDARDPNARLQWQSVDNPLFMLDEKTLKVSILHLSY